LTLNIFVIEDSYGMRARAKKRPSIEEVSGTVTIHVTLPPNVLKSVVKAAKREGHRDISLVICRAIKRAHLKAGSLIAELSPCQSITLGVPL
jgi:hypothetical protein